VTPRPLRLAAGATEVVFEWAGDRWRHRVQSGAADPRRSIVESLEDAVDDAAFSDPRWPASPVIVALMAGPGTPAPTLLGVGAAGRSHFSLAVTVHPTLGDTLLVEVACRVHQRPGRLGSTYRHGAGDAARIVVVAPEPCPEPAGLPRTIRWSYAIGPAGITPGGGTTVAPATTG
jgi:hypothetical protein